MTPLSFLLLHALRLQTAPAVFAAVIATSLIETITIISVLSSAGKKGGGSRRRWKGRSDFGSQVRRAEMALSGKAYSQELVLREVQNIFLERIAMKAGISQNEVRRMIEDGSLNDRLTREQLEVALAVVTCSSGRHGDRDRKFFETSLNRFFDIVEEY